MKTAFTLWEADFSIYHERKGGGYSGGVIFAGGIAEKLDIGRKYDRTAIRRPGFAYAHQHASDESHSIKIQNVWTWHNGESPDWSRRERYVLTIAWWDETLGAWSKCSWHGVTLSEDSLEGQNAVMQELSFSAEYRTPIKTGVGQKPDLLPLEMPCEIWYVDVSERRRLYTYENDALVPVNPLGSRAKIDLSGGQCAILFGDFVAISVIAGVFSCNDLNGMHTYGAVPALEFWSGPFRFATISANGEVDAHDFTESAIPPTSPDNIALMSGSQWQCSIGRAGVTAQSFEEMTKSQ